MQEVQLGKCFAFPWTEKPRALLAKQSPETPSAPSPRPSLLESHTQQGNCAQALRVPCDVMQGKVVLHAQKPLVPCNTLAAPTTRAARPWQAELGLGCRPYHRIVAITGQDDHINGRCVIGHTDASISRSVFSKCKTKVQMRTEERSTRPARSMAWSS